MRGDDELTELRRRLREDPGDREAGARYRRALIRRFGDAPRGLLEDRERWRAASLLEQDAALAALADQLPGWDWSGAETYACGGREERIGTFVERASGISFRVIPGGRYLRGTRDPEAEAAACGVREPGRGWLEDPRQLAWQYEDEAPAHEVLVPPFLLAAHPLSFAQWRRTYPRAQGWPGRAFEIFLTLNGERPALVTADDQPVLATDPGAFRHWLGLQGSGLRLPSEAEWEYACRAGTESRYSWGEGFDVSRCWCRGTAPAGGPPPLSAHAGLTNAFGLSEMHGGVHELCGDRRAASYTGVPETLGYGDARRDHHALDEAPDSGWILRGGDWTSHPARCRSAARYTLGTEIQSIGLRPARSLPAPGEIAPDEQVQEPRRAIEGLWVRLVQGDLAHMQADVLVNAANHELEMGGGVAGALREVCGLEVALEAASLGPAPLGAVVRTSAGKAAAKHLYHAVVIRHSLRSGTSPEDVRVATRRVVEMARADGAQSLCLPLFGSGVGGLTHAQSLEAILQGLEESAGIEDHPLEVSIVAHGPEDHEAASAAWRTFPDQATRAAQVDAVARNYLRLLERRSERDPE